MAHPNIMRWINWTIFRRFVVGVGLAVFFGWISISALSESGSIHLKIAIPLVSIAGGLLALDAISRAIIPTRHPAVRVMAHYGSIREVAHKINVELEEAAPAGDRFVITRNWLVYHSRTTLFLVRLDDLLWAYRRPRTGSFRDGSELMLCTALGDEKAIALDGFEISKILGTLPQRAPWAFYESNDQLQELWKANRPQFIAEVQNRRNLSPSPPPVT